MKKIKIITLIISSLYLLLSTPLFAQSNKKAVNDNSSFFLNDENEIVQKFSWKGNKNVFRYEFILEQQNEEGTFEQINFIDTKETEVSLPLLAGKYRYYLNIYNFLNALDYSTDYINFEIIRTYHPLITSVSPSTIYLEEPQTGIFTVEGLELRPDTIFTVESNFYEIPAKIISTSSDYTKSKIQIDPSLLDTGNYYIRAVNKGDLFDTSGTIKITYKKPMDLDVAIGYSPVIFLDIDKTKEATSGSFDANDTLIEFFSDKREGIFWPLGLDARVTFIPYKASGFFMGTALGINVFRMNYTKNDEFGNELYTITAPAYAAHLDFVAQFILKKNMPWKIVLDTHAGVGAFGFGGLKFDFPNFTTDPLFSADICFNAGFALQFYRFNRFYIEGGCDFIGSITYSQDKSSQEKNNMPLYYLQPRICVGWQF